MTLTVTTNDIDTDNDTLTVTGITQPKNGTAVQNGNNITYTPNPAFTGIDSFTYDISDGNEGVSTGDVTIFVGIPFANNAPVANDDAATTETDTEVTIEVLANDTDADLDNLKVLSVTQLSNGIVENNEINITYIPDAGFSGTETFTYIVSDGKGGTDTATVTVLVDNPPIGVPDSATTTAGTPVTIDVLANDYDSDGDAMTVTAVSVPQNGTAVISDNKVVYTPSAGFTDDDSFTYTVTDSKGGTGTGSVEVRVE